MKMSRSVIVVLVLISILVSSSSAYCDTAASVVIDGSCSYMGANMRTGAESTFILRALSNAPMPEGSDGSSKSVQAAIDGTFSFGRIYFPRPGVYEYEVTRGISDEPSLIEDNSEYIVTVEVFSESPAILVFQKKGEGGKTDRISYIDKQIPPDVTVRNSAHVKTGDSTDIFKYVYTFITALVILIMCFFLFKKSQPNTDSPRCLKIKTKKGKGVKK